MQQIQVANTEGRSCFRENGVCAERERSAGPWAQFYEAW